MKILITGGAGRVGTPVTEKFVANGWDVKVIGVDPEAAIDGIEYAQVDITDYDAVYEHMKDREAVVHLAAIPSTRSHPSHVLFHVNVTGTGNVYEAAANAGIKRVVQASSINAIGSFWGTDDRQFEYFPIDEDFSYYTTDPYSFSKQLIEDVAAYYWRRDGISGTSFRFPAVYPADMVENPEFIERLKKKREHMATFIKLPPDEQNEQLTKARADVLHFRENRGLEYDAIQSGLDKELAQFDSWLWSAYLFDRYNYWSYVHTVDTTQAIEKAIIGDYDGSHPLFINADNNYADCDSETLLRLFFPDTTARSKPLSGTDSLISNDRAYQLIGYEPTYRLNV